MKDLLDAGVISKVQDGVKILGKGVEKFKALNIALNLEVADASSVAIDAIK
jgi:ribosomal protein L15